MPYGRGQVLNIMREMVPMISIPNHILSTELQLESATTLNALFLLRWMHTTYFHRTLPSVRGDGNVLYTCSVFPPVSFTKQSTWTRDQFKIQRSIKVCFAYPVRQTTSSLAEALPGWWLLWKHYWDFFPTTNLHQQHKCVTRLRKRSISL